MKTREETRRSLVASLFTGGRLRGVRLEGAVRLVKERSRSTVPAGLLRFITMACVAAPRGMVQPYAVPAPVARACHYRLHSRLVGANDAADYS